VERNSTLSFRQEEAARSQEIEDLKDIIQELQARQSAEAVADMKHTISKLELENRALKGRIYGLMQEKVTSKQLFHP